MIRWMAVWHVFRLWVPSYSDPLGIHLAQLCTFNWVRFGATKLWNWLWLMWMACGKPAFGFGLSNLIGLEWVFI